MRKILLVGTAALGLQGCNPFSDQLVSSCEEVISNRLRSPSTYSRISAEKNETSMTKDEYIAHVDRDYGDQPSTRELKIRSFNEGSYHPKIFSVFISYDAANANGTPVRATDECTYLSDDGTTQFAAKYTVKINGQTQTEWLSQQVKAMKSQP